MKLIRKGTPSRERVAVLADKDLAVDVQETIDQYRSNWLSSTGLHGIDDVARCCDSCSEIVHCPNRQPTPHIGDGCVRCNELLRVHRLSRYGETAEPTLFFKAGDTSRVASTR